MTEEKKDDGPNRIMVFLRIRPAKKGEIDEKEGTRYLMEVADDNLSVTVEGKAYPYDYIYAGEVDQEGIYSRVGKPVIDNVFKGYWGAVMVYGQTGTGKSFTMCNFDRRCEGIIPRAMRDMFEIVENDSERTYTINFSFIQIYLDKLQDLFNPEAPELKIGRDNTGVIFPGIVCRTVQNGEHFRELYEDGHQHRVITATKMNPESSRGHAALFIQVNSVPKNDPGGENRTGKLFLIDLAGYERFSKTGVTEGLMAQEAKTINASLLSLGSCVQSLSEKSEHIPWRNAKLTRMLEDAIGGKAKCSIILTAGPSSDHIHETMGTLYFGSRAMAVKTEAKLSVNIDYKKLAAKLKELLSNAESKINVLEVEATRRQLEREEAESRFESEWARVKQRQQDQLKELLENGASSDKIQALMRANAEEEEILKEQQYTERAGLEERHESEVKESLKLQEENMQKATSEQTTEMSRDLVELQKQLDIEREDKERYKKMFKDAEAEVRQLSEELIEVKMNAEVSGIELATGDGGKPMNKSEQRKLFDQKLESIKAMLEDNFQLKMRDVEEPLREELKKYQTQYENLKSKSDEDIQNQKDALTSMYEKEISEIRTTSHDVIEKLKSNHMTIKKSYQLQKTRLDKEVDTLTATCDVLTKQLLGAGITPQAVKEGPGSPIQVSNTVMNEKIAEMKSEIDYLTAERDGLSKQLKSITGSGDNGGEERLNPAKVRKLKSENEKMKSRLSELETELFKLRAQQALSGPEKVTSDANDEDENTNVEDLHGDIEGMTTFIKKMKKTPLLPGTHPIDNTYDKILSSLSQDLDEYRQFLRYRLVFVGDAGVGKSSFVKCLTSPSTPMIKGIPDVSPTVFPSILPVSIEDPFLGKTDWHKLYVQFQEVQGVEARGTFQKLMKFGSGGGKNADPARLYLDIIDIPGDRIFWRGLPSFMLAGKNSIYCIIYDVTLPVDIACTVISQQLTHLHACCSRNYPKSLGGDAPRVGFCLFGTRRDMMHSHADSSVKRHLNSIAVSLGETFYRLRGDDNFGLVCVGNFAVSSKDWTVLGIKDQSPKSFKELATFLGTMGTQLYHNTPSDFLAAKEAATHLTFMMGDDTLPMANEPENTVALPPQEKRLRKGIVTLMTSIYREQKTRWFMTDVEFRKLIAAHLDVKESDPIGNKTINYIIRELGVRGLVISLPNCINEPKYLPKTKGETSGDARPLQREGIVVIDSNRLLVMFSLYMAPSIIHKYSNDATFSMDKDSIMLDPKVLEKHPPLYKDGIITEQVSFAAYQRIFSLVSNDVKLLFEFFSVMGLGLCLRSETAILSPAHFSKPMSNLITEYLPYLLSNFGDGIGRKYKINAPCSAFFSRIQTKLIPFSHAPVNDPKFNMFNYCDGSFMVFEKTRLKWGIFGSKALKDAVMSAGIPVRGILKMEGDNLYIAITGKGQNREQSISICTNILSAIHYEIIAITSREFRGIRATYQEMILSGVEEKRKNIKNGIKATLERFKISKDAVRQQVDIIGDMKSDPKNEEIENALCVLPKSELEYN
eukprot:Tbor_TRINITY_DN5801_c5_g1::TRINITY_DN5801_c5_g1_i1::g.6605::m.6605/K10396/KIF5; kinesin family member 5